MAYKNVWDIGKLNGAPYKLEPICNMYNKYIKGMLEKWFAICKKPV